MLISNKYHELRIAMNIIKPFNDKRNLIQFVEFGDNAVIIAVKCV